MNKKIFFTSTLFLLCLLYGITYGQQALLSAGGETSSGIVSYSFGQFAYNTYYGGNSMMAQGVQQAHAIFGDVSGVPETLHIVGINYTNGTENCEGATQTITVAGDGLVEVQSGAIVQFIAGVSIRFLPGFHAKAGSSVNAWITTNGTYCGGPLGSPLLSYDANAEKSVELEADVELTPEILNEKQVKLYPNPNSGRFTVEASNFEHRTEIRVFNLMGKVFYSATVYSPQNVDIDMLNAPRGVYSVLVSDHNTLETTKMVIY